MARLLVLLGALLLALPLLLGAIYLRNLRSEAPARFEPAFAEGVVVGEPRTIVPGDGLPPEVRIDASNNNLDVVRFEGRSYLAVRSAPHHFATDEARILVFSSDDRRRWAFEHEIDLDERDLREPRFLAFQEKLFLYFVELGDDPKAFRPLWIRYTRRTDDGEWRPSKRIFEEGHVVWRVLEHDGRAWMSVYDGAKLYDDLGSAGAVRLLHSEDGKRWTSVSGVASPIDFAGASECAFQFDDDGGLVALVRVESHGALVCTAPADRLERWDCTPTPYRHDSPLLLRHGDAFWAIARRNVAGAFGPETGRRSGLDLWWAMLRYSSSRKRTALYRVLPEERRTAPVLDLPSRGDTAFASAVPLGGDRFWVVNYTSPLDGPDRSWIGGQLVGSVVVGLELELPSR